ncbi:hypothetical protein L3X38_011966 [Prunus dulcis]|uniref:Uncharacterized protein n=1 Tax=Prunus dulcis TaxID=3755 RepID=A0AAD4WK14_PRUDU|nr:hypothetical protein L3X38_011966 [Prunus dulcis]
MIKWVIKQGGFDSPTVRVVSQHRRTNEVSGVNVERIVQEVSISLAPVIQAEVKRSIEGLALGQIIQAEVQRSVLELTDKVMSAMRSFMKDARHEDVNQTKEDGPPKIRDEGGENVVKKKGEESRKLKEKGLVHVNNPWMPLPDGHTFSEPKLKIGVEKRKFTKLARGDQSRIQTRRTAERRPGLHRREPWVDPSNAKGKAVQKTASKIKIGPFKLKPEDLQDSDFELFSYIFRSNNFSSLPGAKYNASRYQLAERIMKVLDYIYNDEIVKYFDKGWQFAKFNIVRTDKARRQLNGCDCGSRCTIVAEEPKNKRLKEVRESARRVVDEELDKLGEHGPSIPHHPIARKPMTLSQAK